MNRFLARHLGSEQFTHKQVLGMLLPLILDQLFIYAISLLTTSMISSSGQDSVTAVSLVTPINLLLIAIYTAFASGGAVVIAQYKGHGDQKRLQEAIGQTVWFVMVVAIVTNGIVLALSGPIIELLFGAAEASVKAKAKLYLGGMAINAVVHALRVGTSAGLRGVGDIKHNLVGSLVINISFFGFSFVFINMLHMDIMGTLVSYFLARFLGLLISLYFLFFQKNGQVRIHLKQALKPKVEYLKSIWHLGLPFSAEEIFFNTGSILVSSYMVLLGTVSVAAHAIANSVFTTLCAPTLATGILATTVIGQCIGAGRRDLARWYGKKLCALGYVIALLSILIMLPLLPGILSLYHPEAETLTLTWQLLWIGMVGMLAFWPISTIMPNVLRAAGDAYYSTIISLVTMWALRVGMGYVIALPLGFGIRGVWICMGAEWLVRCILYVIRYRGPKWLSKKAVMEE